jgi:membrane protein
VAVQVHASTIMSEPETVREPSSGALWLEFLRAWRHPVRLLREFVSRLQQNDDLTAAAALAYYFLFSIFPLLVFVLALASLLPVQGLETWLLDNARESLPGEAYALVERTVHGLLHTRRGGLLSLGAALALWTASSAFTALTNALNRAYRVRDPRPWWRVRLWAIALTIGLSLMMIVAFVFTLFGGQLVHLIGSRLGPAAEAVALVVRWTITVGAGLFVVTAIYYACPAIDREWQWVRPGAVLFMVGFGGMSAAFSYYVNHFGSYDATYGSLGAVIILLLWMYLLAVFLLVGGEVNALLECRVHERVAAEQQRLGELATATQDFLGREPDASVSR